MILWVLLSYNIYYINFYLSDRKVKSKERHFTD